MEDEHAKAVFNGHFRYLVYGWIVFSERALPYLVPAPPKQGVPDIFIRFAPVFGPEIGAVTFIRDMAIFADGRAIYAPMPELRFLIEDGRSITVDCTAALSDAGLHAILFGPPMAWLCHQRGLPPLHACAIEIGGSAIGLTGNSGAGKSTTARALIARGHGLLTDDQIVVAPEDPLVHPGYPSIKLWAESARNAGDSLQSQHRVDHHFDKFHIPLPQAFRPQPAPLALIVILIINGDALSPRIEPVRVSEAAALLQHFIFRADAGRSLDGGRRGFAWSLALARKIPVIKLFRPQDLSVLTDTCIEIEHRIDRAIAAESLI